MDNYNEISWVDPWHPVTGASSFMLTLELRFEMCRKHPLSKKKVKAIARCGVCDDVLYAVEDDLKPFAVVHLTWTGQRETNTEFPWIVFYSSIDEWVEKCMKVDHKDTSIASASVGHPT